MLIIHMNSIFNIKTPRTLVARAPLGLLIVKTLTNALLTITKTTLKSVQRSNRWSQGTNVVYFA